MSDLISRFFGVFMAVDGFPIGKEDKSGFDVLCFSHLRWDFVFQRPQHLMTRFAKQGRVFIIEEPIASEGDAFFEMSRREEGLSICIPRVPEGWTEERTGEFVRNELADLIETEALETYITWFYTPMMIEWSRGLEPSAIVYDCMDELSAFKNAPAVLREREAELFAVADVVFTGGKSLFEVKREQHRNVHAFPSSIDTAHFGKAREIGDDLENQRLIPRPRIGFVGVIDERMDIGLVGKIAAMRPDWQFVMVGPVVKIDPGDLPVAENIHYLGQRSYDDLPAFLAGWDVAIMPFALNESTRYISPTKTPEYLAAGLPVVSTPITDVVTPYGELDLVRIALTPQEFVNSIESAMNEDQAARRKRVDEFLGNFSWDKTFKGMVAEIRKAVAEKAPDHAEAAAL